ncbi:uncharacterized protein LOC130294256 [Hyla sarda]|uniref:uncharacterized protein LOC130294256 n=1 Tax=Hyla sarda TaxID=327740 RepID=UPI0024C3E8BB|nr:uncharacterized protein LOC130294256 [Hyla sarda]
MSHLRTCPSGSLVVILEMMALEGVGGKGDAYDIPALMRCNRDKMLRVITLLLLTSVLISLCVQGHGRRGRARRRCYLPHQVWKDCGSACPLNCENYKTPPSFCSMGCVSGCFCRAPYIFFRGTDGICVLPKYSIHGGVCQSQLRAVVDRVSITVQTTQSIKMFKVCTLLLLFSMVLQSLASSGQHDCAAHQNHVTCGTACPENCQNYGTEANHVCTKQCVAACFCKIPYIFKIGKSGECVLPDECPKRFIFNWDTIQMGQKSSVEKMWRLTVILFIAVIAHQMIDANHKGNHKGEGALCIAEGTGWQPRAEVGIRCPEIHQTWEDCGSACPMSCQLLRSGHVPCPMNCVPGCYCQSPYIFRSGVSGPCILPEKCPQKNVSKKTSKRQKTQLME